MSSRVATLGIYLSSRMNWVDINTSFWIFVLVWVVLGSSLASCVALFDRGCTSCLLILCCATNYRLCLSYILFIYFYILNILYILYFLVLFCCDIVFCRLVLFILSYFCVFYMIFSIFLYFYIVSLFGHKV